jgi:hypothetical protein
MLALEGRAQARQEFVGEGVRAGQAHAAAAQALQGLDLAQCALGVQPCAARVVGQDFAGRVEHHAARVAVEQRRAQQPLQRRDLAADGRGRHMQPRRGLGQRSALRDFVEVAQCGVLQQEVGGVGHGGSIVINLPRRQGRFANLLMAAKGRGF